MSIISQDFAPTTPSETTDRGIDYSYAPLATGEYLASATCTIELDGTEDGATVDASPSTRKTGSVGIEDSEITDLADMVVVQRLTGMVDGNTYRVIFRATTSNGQIIERYGLIACRVAA